MSKNQFAHYYKNNGLKKSKNIFRQTDCVGSFNFLKATFLTLSLFLIFYSSGGFMFTICSLILIILLIKTYKLILCSFLGCLCAIAVHQLTSPFLLHFFINEDVKITHLSPYGPIFTIHGSKVLIRSAEHFNVGDIVKIRGQIINFSNQNIALQKTNSLFKNINLNYLLSFNIHNLIVKPEVQLIKKHDSYFVLFKNYLSAYPLLLGFLTGIKRKENQHLYVLMMKLNVTHLFVMSGFHVTIIKKTIYGIMHYLKIPQYFQAFMTLSIIGLICYLLDFNASLLRASLLVTLQIINKFFYKRKGHVINLGCVIFLLMFILGPYHIFAINFILTFIASLTIYLSNDFVSKKRIQTIHTNYHNSQMSIVKKIAWSFFPIMNVYLITGPIIVSLNGYINFSSFFINLILSPLVIAYQFLSLIFLGGPLGIDFLSFTIINWCYFYDFFSLIIKLN